EQMSGRARSGTVWLLFTVYRTPAGGVGFAYKADCPESCLRLDHDGSYIASRPQQPQQPCYRRRSGTTTPRWKSIDSGRAVAPFAGGVALVPVLADENPIQ